MAFIASGKNAPSIQGEIAWISQVLSTIVQQQVNGKVVFLYFVNNNGPWNNEGTVIDQAYLGYFDSLMQAISQTPSAVEGVQLEDEYEVNASGTVCGITCATPALFQAFSSEVTRYGLQAIAPYPGNASYFSLVLDYSPYPYYGYQIETTLSSSKSVGVGYGETGACGSVQRCAAGMSVDPIYGLWTSSVVTSIVDTSASASEFTFLYCNGGTSYPQFLWDDPTLRNWIWTDPIYQSEYMTSAMTTVTLSSGSASSFASSSPCTFVDECTSTATSSVTGTTLSTTSTYLSGKGFSSASSSPTSYSSETTGPTTTTTSGSVPPSQSEINLFLAMIAALSVIAVASFRVSRRRRRGKEEGYG